MRRQPASVVLTVPSRKVVTVPPRAISSACAKRKAMISLASLRPSSPLMPALLTSISRREVISFTSSNIFATAAGSETSAASPWPPSRSAVAAAASAERSLMMIRAPSSAKRCAMAAPKPRAAPVMSATLSFSLSMPSDPCFFALHLAFSDAPFDHDVQKGRPRPREGAPERARHRLGVGDLFARHSERPCQRRKIDGRIGEVHADVVIVAVEGAKALLDDAIAAIVGDDVGDRQPVMGGR